MGTFSDGSEHEVDDEFGEALLAARAAVRVESHRAASALAQDEQKDDAASDELDASFSPIPQQTPASRGRGRNR